MWSGSLGGDVPRFTTALLLLYYCLTAAALLQVVAGGHFGAVSDVEWEPGGKYLVSVSKDQTARLWAEWTQGASVVKAVVKQ
jgi:hypothetical protein